MFDVTVFGSNMNWLAHLFLSEQNTDHQLGNLLCDPCKGHAFEGASDAFKQGLKMHKSIDAFTDAHASFLQSKSRLTKKGHLKGVVIDLTYDVFLTQCWDEYCDRDLNTFLDDFYHAAPMALTSYPSQARAFVEKLIQVDHLRQYHNLDDLEETFKRVDKRLSANVLKRESTLDYFPLIEQNFSVLKNDFKTFFPQLLSHVQTLSDNSKLGHWQPLTKS